MSVFEPKAVIAILRNSSLVKASEREKFKAQWAQSASIHVLDSDRVVVDLQ